MHDGLGVGLRLKFHALGGQFVFEFEKIFDDAVLHDNDALRLPEMRVRIPRVRRAVSRPARVTDPWRARDGRFLDEIN